MCPMCLCMLKFVWNESNKCENGLKWCFVVIWSFVKFGGQTPKNVQGVPKITRKTFIVCHVWTSYWCLFWMKFMWKVYKLLRSIIRLETSGYDFLRAPQEAQKEGPKPVWRLSQADPGDGAVNGQSWLWRPVKGSRRERIIQGLREEPL